MLTLPGLFQTTAFGLTGLVTLDMLSEIVPSMRAKPIDLIFLDTLYHFDETLALVDRVRAWYPNVKIHVYKPNNVSTAAEFESRYGAKLWETDDERYDWLAKVEPSRRAYADLNVRAVLTGRRRSQGGQRGSLDILEFEDGEDANDGGNPPVLKVNPLANWSFAQVRAYIDQHDVPYNTLLDQGYSSVGDWHSTQPARPGEGERSGRWSGSNKTECGIHNAKSRYAEFLREQERKKEQDVGGNTAPVTLSSKADAKMVRSTSAAVAQNFVTSHVKTDQEQQQRGKNSLQGTFNGVLVHA